MVDNHKWAGNGVGETHVIDQMGMVDKRSWEDQVLRFFDYIDCNL